MVLVAGFADVDARWRWGPLVSTSLFPPLSFSFFSPLTPLLTAAVPHASPTPAPATLLPQRRPPPCTSRHPPWPRRRCCGRARCSLRPPSPLQVCTVAREERPIGAEGGGADVERAGSPAWRETADGGSCRDHGRWSTWMRPTEVRHHRRRSPTRDLIRGRRSRRPRARPRAAGPELCSSAGAPPCATGARGAAAAAGLTHGVELARP
jgi:hypothetical protein